jgi:hypothetical protein
MAPLIPAIRIDDARAALVLKTGVPTLFDSPK